jgi:hypothetical protein
MEKIDGEYAIYPFINISANILSNDNLIRYIVSAYTSDEFNSHIKGFYLMIDGLDTNLVSEEDLRGLLKLVKGLSHKEVYIVSINAFGYATLLLGATGFVSGLASNETTSVETWKLDIEERKKLRSRSREFTYVPEVFTYITEYELQQIGYSCSCAHCKNSLPLKPSDKKIHFYECRKRDIENIFTGDFKQNYSALLKCYEQGRDEARKLLLERKTTRNSNIILTPISKWISALQEAENIEKQDEAEIKLTQILEDIDNYDKSSN